MRIVGHLAQGGTDPGQRSTRPLNLPGHPPRARSARPRPKRPSGLSTQRLLRGIRNLRTMLDSRFVRGSSKNRSFCERRAAPRSATAAAPARDARAGHKLSGMAPPRHSHVTQRGYLRVFTSPEGALTVHQVSDGRTYDTGTKEVGVRSNFYRRKRPDGGNAWDTEESLRAVEDKSLPLLREIRARWPLSAEDKAAIAQVIAAQHVRVPNWREFIGEVHEESFAKYRRETLADVLPSQRGRDRAEHRRCRSRDSYRQPRPSSDALADPPSGVGHRVDAVDPRGVQCSPADHLRSASRSLAAEPGHVAPVPDAGRSGAFERA